LIKFHPNGHQALENLSGSVSNYHNDGIPFHNAVGGWLSINLLEKNNLDEEKMAAFSIVGALIQQSLGSWFKINKKSV